MEKAVGEGVVRDTSENEAEPPQSVTFSLLGLAPIDALDLPSLLLLSRHSSSIRRSKTDDLQLVVC